jgi:hypothetical protein
MADRSALIKWLKVSALKCFFLIAVHTNIICDVIEILLGRTKPAGKNVTDRKKSYVQAEPQKLSASLSPQKRKVNKCFWAWCVEKVHSNPRSDYPKPQTQLKKNICVHCPEEGLSMDTFIMKFLCLELQIIASRCHIGANLQHRLLVVQPLVRIWRIQTKRLFWAKKKKTKTTEGFDSGDF